MSERWKRGDRIRLVQGMEGVAPVGATGTVTLVGPMMVYVDLDVGERVLCDPDMLEREGSDSYTF